MYCYYNNMSTVIAGRGAPPTDPEGPTGALAMWVHDVELDDIPPAIVERAKHLILDGVGCALMPSKNGGSRT